MEEFNDILYFQRDLKNNRTLNQSSTQMTNTLSYTNMPTDSKLNLSSDYISTEQNWLKKRTDQQK